jgi:multisubunit Na+/H+ antiporter MnhG subunit
VSPTHVIAAVLLVIAFASAVVSVVGVARMRGVQDQLHYLAPVSAVGGGAVALAVVVVDGLNTRGLKAVLVLAILAGLNPVLVHATARVARVRSSGRR